MYYICSFKSWCHILFFCESFLENFLSSENVTRKLTFISFSEGLIFFMLKLSFTEENMKFIINFISAVSNNEHLDEVLELLEGAVKTGSHSFITTLAGAPMFFSKPAVTFSAG